MKDEYQIGWSNMRILVFILITLFFFPPPIMAQEHSSDYWIQRGNEFYKNNSHDLALRCYDKAIEIDPLDADAWNSKGNIIKELGRAKEAAEAFAKAIELGLNKPDEIIEESYAISSSTTTDREGFSEAAEFIVSSKIEEEAPESKRNHANRFASVTNVEEVAGPYVIEFDLTNSSTQLNSSETYWDVSDPVLSLGGTYVVLKNDTNYVVASIAIQHSARHNGLIFIPNYIESGLIDKGYSNVETYVRTIDGRQDATLTVAESPTGEPYHLAEYRLDENTMIEIKSWMPMNGGTSDLLNTIHISALVTSSQRRQPAESVYETTSNAKTSKTSKKLPIQATWTEPATNITAEDCLNKGKDLNNQSKYIDAIEAFNEAIRIDPKLSAAWNGKGNALGKQDRYDEAIEAYDEAIRLNSSYAGAWSNKGGVLSKQGKYSEAMAAFDEAIRLDPKLSAAWNNKGNALKKQGKYDEAIEVYDEAIGINPNDANALYSKSGALGEQKRYDEALKACNEAIRLDPNFAGAWNNKGNALYEQGRYNEAFEAYDEAIRLNPAIVPAVYRIDANFVNFVPDIDEEDAPITSVLMLRTEFIKAMRLAEAKNSSIDYNRLKSDPSICLLMQLGTDKCKFSTKQEWDAQSALLKGRNYTATYGYIRVYPWIEFAETLAENNVNLEKYGWPDYEKYGI